MDDFKKQIDVFDKSNFGADSDPNVNTQPPFLTPQSTTIAPTPPLPLLPNICEITPADNPNLLDNENNDNFLGSIDQVEAYLNYDISRLRARTAENRPRRRI